MEMEGFVVKGNSTGRRPALVRLRRQGEGAVEVRCCAVKNRAVSNGNCVAARRGGEQRNENDQSVTLVVRVGRRELDSVGVSGRVCVRKTKPVGAGKTRWQPGGPRTTRRWLETEWSEVLLQ
jgi:hypothetical protein